MRMIEIGKMNIHHNGGSEASRNFGSLIPLRRSTSCMRSTGTRRNREASDPPSTRKIVEKALAAEAHRGGAAALRRAPMLRWEPHGTTPNLLILTNCEKPSFNNTES